MKQAHSFIPLIAPKSIHQHTAASFREYVKSLYLDPAIDKPPLRDVFAGVSKKGVLSIRFNRKPKEILPGEVDQLYDDALELGVKMKRCEFWVLMTKRKIPIVKKLTLVPEIKSRP